jgi:haloalkane dehalogenase
MKKTISAEFPYKSQFINILESNIHYIDINKENNSETTFLFIHGNPTSSYLWRNIIPYVSPLGRTVALDLIGMGKSGKPKIEYTFQDHIEYLNKFIKKLELKNIVLIIHDWGGALGFNYAKNHSKNVKGIVFMETFAKPMEWNDLNFMARWIFKIFRHPIKGQKWNGKYNVFLRFILQASMIRKLSKQEKQTYLEPFKTIESRKPIVKFPQELPFKYEGTLNEKIAIEYFEWLKKSTIPKLLLYANPGVQIQEKQLKFYKNNLKELTTAFIGKGKHYIQEDQPENIGEAIEQWYLINLQ